MATSLDNSKVAPETSIEMRADAFLSNIGDSIDAVNQGIKAVNFALQNCFKSSFFTKLNQHLKTHRPFFVRYDVDTLVVMPRQAININQFIVAAEGGLGSTQILGARKRLSACINGLNSALKDKMTRVLRLIIGYEDLMSEASDIPKQLRDCINASKGRRKINALSSEYIKANEQIQKALARLLNLGRQAQGKRVHIAHCNSQGALDES